MEQQSSGAGSVFAGAGLFGLGLFTCATPAAPLGIIFMLVGVVLMCFFGPTGTYHPVVNYHIETHDQHIHLYPRQNVTEGREFSRQKPDGTTETLRYLRRLE